MTLDINNDVLTHFKPFFSLYTLPHTSVGLTGSISIFLSFEYFDSFDKRSLLCLFNPGIDCEPERKGGSSQPSLQLIQKVKLPSHSPPLRIGV